jgi:hypothetical protein
MYLLLASRSDDLVSLSATRVSRSQLPTLRGAGSASVAACSCAAGKASKTLSSPVASAIPEQSRQIDKEVRTVMAHN